MASIEQYIGQRLSLKGQPCTIRYIGSVADKQGVWVGVEWDDTSRGKHNGTHDGVSYFTCRSKSATAGSFLRPKQPWDKSRAFLEALREKYISPENATNSEIVYISGKHAEEVGLEKFAKRQAELQGIHSLVLDRMCIRHQNVSNEDSMAITVLCSGITALDLGSNLFETFDEVLSLCRLFPRLASLTLDGNRFSVSADDGRNKPLLGIRNFSLSQSLLNPSEVAKAIAHFPSLDSLTVADNELSVWNAIDLPTSVQSIDLSNNHIEALLDIETLSLVPGLRSLLLKGNKISAIESSGKTHQPISTFEDLEELELRDNTIFSWTFFSRITKHFPKLKHLRVAGNPLFVGLKSAEGKPLTSEDGYMLTIARLPQLETLNYSKITDKERLNAEAYYLNQIAAELSTTRENRRQDIIQQHPRWAELCEEYGEPSILRQPKPDEIDPNTLAARLVKINFSASASFKSTTLTSWTEEVPKSLTVYALLGLVGKKLGVMPLTLRLIWETGERDPVRAEGSEMPEWWDSSEEEEEDAAKSEWVSREVELVAGTRILATYFEGREAKVRVEAR